jgi:hypothetical protein
MTLGQVGCIDLDLNSSYNPRVGSTPDYESDCHHRPERSILTSYHGPILINFDENRFLHNDERFVSLSSRSRFLIILAMMLPLSVAFTALSNHILVPISYHISSEWFSPTEDNMYRVYQAANGKTFFAKIVSSQRGELRNSANINFTTHFSAFLSWDFSFIHIDHSISQLLEKSQLSHMYSVSGNWIMKILDILPHEDVKSDSKITPHRNSFDMPPLVHQIWNNGNPQHQSKKVDKREFLFEMPDPVLPWTIDLTSSDSKADNQSPRVNFPLIERLLSRKSYASFDRTENGTPDYRKCDNWQKNKISPSTNPSRPAISQEDIENGLASFMPTVFRLLSPSSSGSHTDTNTKPSPSPQWHTHLTQSAQSLISDSDQSLEPSHLSSRFGSRQRGSRRRSTLIRFRRVSV